MRVDQSGSDVRPETSSRAVPRERHQRIDALTSNHVGVERDARSDGGGLGSRAARLLNDFTWDPKRWDDGVPRVSRLVAVAPSAGGRT